MWEMVRSPDALLVLDRVDAEVENFRAAFEWGLDNHVEESVRLAANFCAASTMLSIPAEGGRMITTAVERARSLPPAAGGEAGIRRQKLIARALYIQGVVGMGVGNMPLVLQVLQEAIALSRATGDKRLLGYSLATYYVATTFINAPDGEIAAQEAFHIFNHEVDDSLGPGMAYMIMARLSSSKGDEREKERYIGRLREMVHEMPRSFQVGNFILGIGMDERLHGNYDSARRIFEEGLELFKRLHSRYFVLVMHSELGHVERQTGNLALARSIYQETIKGWQDLGNRSAVAHELECFGFLAVHDEEPRGAVKLFGAAEALREKNQSPMADYERFEYDRAVAHVRSMLAEEEFSSVWAEGRAMRMEQAVQFALEAAYD